MDTSELLGRIDPDRPLVTELRRIAAEDGAAEAVPPSAPQRPGFAPVTPLRTPPLPASVWEDCTVLAADEVYDQDADTAGLTVPVESPLRSRATGAGLWLAVAGVIVLCAMGLHDVGVIIARHWRGTAQLVFVLLAAAIVFSCGVAVDRIDRRRGR